MPIVTFSSGAEVAIWNRNQKTPLDLARDNERLDAARLLKEWAGCVDSQDRINSTLLASSSQGSSPNVEQPSVGHGEDIFILAGVLCCIPHRTTGKSKYGSSHSLLEGGGDVNDRDAFHRTALLLASRTGKFQVAQLLIKCGAEVNCTDGVGWTPLHVATFGGHIDIVHMLLDHGADVKCDEYGPTGLHCTTRRTLTSSISPKLYFDQEATVNERNDDGRTEFQIAATRGHRTIMRLLSEYGAHHMVDCRGDGRDHWVLFQIRNTGAKPYAQATCVPVVKIRATKVDHPGGQSKRWVCGSVFGGAIILL